jgi:DNA-binding response OmpR family regulator
MSGLFLGAAASRLQISHNRDHVFAVEITTVEAESLDKMDILIADDDLISRNYLWALLESMGHFVIACEDGRSAWSVFRMANFRVAILNAAIPEMSGLDVCRAIREAGQYPRCHVIISTSRVGEDDQNAMREAGADDFVARPFQKDDIIARMSAIEGSAGLAAFAS